LGAKAEREDYQDLSIWRHLTADIARRIHEEYETDLVIPMCIWRHDYFTKMTTGLQERNARLFCFRLTRSKEALSGRIFGRPDAEGGHARDDSVRVLRRGRLGCAKQPTLLAGTRIQCRPALGRSSGMVWNAMCLSQPRHVSSAPERSQDISFVTAFFPSRSLNSTSMDDLRSGHWRAPSFNLD
jgi:hypothetical protein